MAHMVLEECVAQSIISNTDGQSRLLDTPKSLVIMIMEIRESNSANRTLRRDRCHMAKPAVGTGVAWPIARPSRSSSVILSKNDTTHSHHERLVVGSSSPIGSGRSLCRASAESARGGIPSDSKLGDTAPSVHYHPTCQRSGELDHHLSLGAEAIVWNVNHPADPRGQGHSPPSCTGFNHFWTTPSGLG